MSTATQTSRTLQAGSIRTPPEDRFGTNNGAQRDRLRACWRTPSATSKSKPPSTDYKLKICKTICAWTTKGSSRTSSLRTIQRALLHLVSMYHRLSPHLLRQTTIPQLYRRSQPRYPQRQHTTIPRTCHRPLPRLQHQTTISQLYRRCQLRYLQRQHSLCSCPLRLPPHHDQLSHQVCRFLWRSVLLDQSDSTTNRGRECCRAAISLLIRVRHVAMFSGRRTSRSALWRLPPSVRIGSRILRSSAEPFAMAGRARTSLRRNFSRRTLHPATLTRRAATESRNRSPLHTG